MMVVVTMTMLTMLLLLLMMVMSLMMNMYQDLAYEHCTGHTYRLATMQRMMSRGPR